MKEFPCVYLRGGTSRALFFREEDLPQDRSQWPQLFLKALGYKRDHNGKAPAMGPDFPTRKVAVISPSSRADADVNYNFFQIDPDNMMVDNRGNCGNMSSAVGPYAINEGLVEAVEPVTRVRIFNTNTQRIISAQVPVENGKAAVKGDARIFGVPGTAAPIDLTFENPGGGFCGKLFPTGNPKDVLEIPGFGPLEVTLIDCTNPVVFLRARDVGLTGGEILEINRNPELLRMLDTVRGVAAQKFGLVEKWEDAAKTSTYIPFLALVAEPQDYVNIDGGEMKAEEMDLCCRAVFSKVHRAYPMSAAVATAAAARIPGTVAAEMYRPSSQGEVILGHAAGTTPVQISMDGDHVVSGTILRTAQYLFRGTIYLEE